MNSMFKCNAEMIADWDILSAIQINWVLFSGDSGIFIHYIDWELSNFLFTSAARS